MSLVALPMRFRLLATASGIVALAACGPSISSDRDSTIPIPAGATVEFEGGTVDGPQSVDPAVQNSIVHRRIQLAIISELQKKGYTLVDSNQTATFRVRYFVGIKQNTEYVTTTTGVASPYYGPWGYGYGYGWGAGYGYGYGGAITTTQPVTSTNASFVVDLQDEKSGNTAWRGIWQGSPGPRAPTEDQINTTVAKVFATMPKVP